MSQNNGSRVPPLLVEKLAAGEWNVCDRHRIDARADAKQQRQMIEWVDTSNRELLKRYPIAAFVATVYTKSSQQQEVSKNTRFTRVSSFATLAAAACLALLCFWQGGRYLPNQTSNQSVVLKGQEPYLVVYRKSAQGFETLRSGTEGHEGDILQLRYVAAGYRFGVILSIDGRGKTTLHHPAEAHLRPELKPSGEIALPYAYQLDDAPAFEHFFLVTSNSPLSVAETLEKARKWSTDGAFERVDVIRSADVKIFSLVIRKPSHE